MLLIFLGVLACLCSVALIVFLPPSYGIIISTLVSAEYLIHANGKVSDDLMALISAASCLVCAILGIYRVWRVTISEGVAFVFAYFYGMVLHIFTLYNVMCSLDSERFVCENSNSAFFVFVFLVAFMGFLHWFVSGK